MTIATQKFPRITPLYSREVFKLFDLRSASSTRENVAASGRRETEIVRGGPQIQALDITM